MISRFVPAIALVAAVGMAGCGGDSAGSGSSSATAASVSATSTQASTTASTSTTSGDAGASSSPSASTGGAGMVAVANSICARRNSELNATTHAGASLRAILDATSRRAAIERKALAELVRLTPPQAVAGEWRKVVLSTGSALQRTLALERISHRSDSASVSRQRTLLNKPLIQLLIAATRAGVKQCASVAGPTASPVL